MAVTVAKIVMTATATVTLAEVLAAEIAKTAATASVTVTSVEAPVVETAKVTASERVIVTALSSLREATLAIEQTRVALSAGVAEVTVVVAKTAANGMTCGIAQEKSRAAPSHAPLAKVAVTPAGLTRAAIGSVDATEMTLLIQSRTQCCLRLKNQQDYWAPATW